MTKQNKIACNRIEIDSPDGLLIFRVGEKWKVENTINLIISHLTWDIENKIVMVRDENNLIRLYNYNSIKVAPIMPFPQDGMKVRNIF